MEILSTLALITTLITLFVTLLWRDAIIKAATKVNEEQGGIFSDEIMIAGTTALMFAAIWSCIFLLGGLLISVYTLLPIISEA